MEPEVEAATRKRLAAAKIENMENEQHEKYNDFLNPQVKKREIMKMMNGTPAGQRSVAAAAAAGHGSQTHSRPEANYAPTASTHDTEHRTRFSCLSITFCQLPIHCGSSAWFKIAPPVGHPIRLCHAGPIIPSHLHAGWRCTCDAVSRNLRAAGLLVYARGTGHARQTCLKRTCLCYLPATPPRGRWLY